MVLSKLLPIFAEGSLGYKSPDWSRELQAHTGSHSILVKVLTPAVAPIL
jgi:hypothetical protein